MVDTRRTSTVKGTAGAEERWLVSNLMSRPSSLNHTTPSSSTSGSVVACRPCGPKTDESNDQDPSGVGVAIDKPRPKFTSSRPPGMPVTPNEDCSTEKGCAERTGSVTTRSVAAS
ncbi:MAG: hypothetical protein R2752_20150 [Vicinamibacterales bacterium]